MLSHNLTHILCITILLIIRIQVQQNDTPHDNMDMAWCGLAARYVGLVDSDL